MTRFAAALPALALLLPLLAGPPAAAGTDEPAQPTGPCTATSTIDEAEGGPLDVDRFGAAYSCASNELTFTFITHEAFTNAEFSEAYVRIDTDGNLGNGCGEGDYLAYAVNRADEPGDEIDAAVFRSPTCEDLEGVDLVGVTRADDDSLAIAFDRGMIGDPTSVAVYGSLAAVGENTTSADYAPGDGHITLDTGPLPMPEGVATCQLDEVGDVVVRDEDGQSPVDKPAADVTRVCAHYGDGLRLDVELPGMDVVGLGRGAGPAALIDVDGDGDAERLLRAVWDGAGFVAQVTNTSGTPVCDARVRISGTSMRIGAISPDCIGAPVSFNLGAAMGGISGPDAVFVDRAGNGPFTVRRAAGVTPGNEGVDPAGIQVDDPGARDPRPGLYRLAGPARVETSVEVSRDAWPEGAAAAVLARQDVEADALAGAPLAAAINGPLVLTASTGLSVAAAAELRRALPLGARVYVLGGTGALDTQVVADVQQLGYGTVRLAGPSRVETGAAIAREAAEFLEEVRHVLIADAFSFQSALVAGAAAGANAGVVVTTGPEGLSAEARAVLDDHPDAQVTAVGGVAAQAAPDAAVIDGGDPHETAVGVAEAFFPDATRAAVASVAQFPDGLAGGAFGGSLGLPLLLSPADELATATEVWIRDREIDEVYLLGGPAALSASVEAALRPLVS